MLTLMGTVALSLALTTPAPDDGSSIPPKVTRDWNGGHIPPLIPYEFHLCLFGFGPGCPHDLVWLPPPRALRD